MLDTNIILIGSNDIKNNYKFKGVLEVYDKMGHYEYLDKT